MILVGLGSNKSGPWGNPRQSVERALAELDRWPLRLIRASTLIDTDPYGKKNQPRYVNAVASIATALPPEELMRHLLAIERRGGRQRQGKWGPRTIDLDLVDYHGRLMRQRSPKEKRLSLPHPGLADRSFVLQPIAEIAPRWVHPIFRQTAQELLRNIRD